MNFKKGDKVVFVVYDEQWQYVPEKGKVYVLGSYEPPYFIVRIHGGNPIFRPDKFRLATLLEIELQS